MNRFSKNIIAAFFMVIGAVAGAVVMALLVPVRERGLLELRLGLAIGVLVGYSVFRIGVYFLGKRGG